MDEKETFLARWSRRKLQASVRAHAPKPAAARAQAAGAGAADEPLPSAGGTQLPQVESLDGLNSEYTGFLDPQVDEKLRQAALKKLFGDPHFNVMDGLDTYIDDYSKPDPIPAAMLRQLQQAQALSLFEEEATDGKGAAADGAQAPVTVPPASVHSPAPEAGAVDAPEDAARSPPKPNIAT